MKESLWGYWLILLGIIIITVMILLQNYTTTNQQDYYLAKEITYAAMYDAVDYGYYKKNGELRIVKEKFVENFIRRFAESATLNKTYTVNFYSIYETPPAVSIEIRTNTGEYLVGEESINAGVTTRLTAILETKNKSVSGLFTNVYSSTHLDKSQDSLSVTHTLSKPSKEELNLAGYPGEVNDYNISIAKVDFVRNFISNSDLIEYENNYKKTFGVDFPNNVCAYTKTKCRLKHYGTLKNSVNFDIEGEDKIKWEAVVQDKCMNTIGELSSFGSGNNNCVYGIVYQVEWKVESK